MTKVLECDCSSSDAYVSETLSMPGTGWYIQADLAVPTATLTALIGATDYGTGNLISIQRSPSDDGFFLGDFSTAGSLASPTAAWHSLGGGSAYAAIFPADALNTVIAHYDGTNLNWIVNGTTIATYVLSFATASRNIRFGGFGSNGVSGELYYVTNVFIGTTLGGSELFSDDFATGNTSAWSPGPSGSVSVIDSPFVPFIPTPPGRVLIAFDDVPLAPSPTWTAIDQAGAFPDQFVSGYDTSNGRQTLISQTDTGTATVYINDHEAGLFDPRNSSSPYFGKLDGRQIMLQLYNPITTVWESQFRGWIDDVTYDIDGSAVNAAGEPINASLQIECVDVLDYLTGFGLTPGLAGIAPPPGYEDGVYYAEGHVDDRLIEIFTDALIDSTRYHATSGNVRVRPVKYDPDESALTAARDAVDAEFPFIGCLFVDRFGVVTFRGRYSRFAPDSVAAEPGSNWDFTRWALGDGAAIVADSSRAQMRVLSYLRGRSNIINVAIAYPQDLKPKDMQDQVWADGTSITDYGQHAAPPMSDLLTADDGLQSGNPDAKTECSDYAKLLVFNQKDPREAISSLQVKTVHPTDARATTTWAFLTMSDISHIVNVAVGYPAGTGLTGASPADDYYIEGRSLVVRPLEPGFDYVELNCEVSPAIWSMDIHGVFPPFS